MKKNFLKIEKDNKKTSFPFVFEATIFWYDDIERVAHTEKVAGVGSCTDFTNAMKQIEQRYKDELVSIERLESIGEQELFKQTIIPIKREWVSSFIEEDGFFDWVEEIKK